MESRARLKINDVIAKLRENNTEFKALKFQSIVADLIEGAWDPVFSLQDEHLIALAEAIKQNTTLERLVINNHHEHRRWTARGAEALGEALMHHPRLNRLEIYFSAGETPSEHILGMLKCFTGTAQIEYFKLHAFIATEKIPAVLNEIGRMLSHSHSLKEIYIENMLFEPPVKPVGFSLSEFAQGLGAQAELRVLTLTHLPLFPEGMQEIANALRTAFLTTLDVCACYIENTTEAICSIALRNPHLRELGIRYMPIRETGIRQLTAVLPQLNLSQLDLSRTKMTTAAFDLFVSIYLENPLNISKLILESIKFKKIDPSFDLMAKLLDGNVRLKILKLGYCHLEDQHLKKLEPILKDRQRCGLEELDLDGQQYFEYVSGIAAPILYENEYLTLRIPSVKANSEYQVAFDINKTKKAIRESKENDEAHRLVSWCSEEKPQTSMFLARKFTSPHLMPLPDIMKTIIPYLEKVESNEDNKENFSIDLSHLENGEQRYIKAIFVRFFEIADWDIMNKRYEPPKVSIDAETNKLIINGLTIRFFEKMVSASPLDFLKNQKVLMRFIA